MIAKAESDSTMGTARGRTQGSCLPVTDTSTDSFCWFMVCWGICMDDVGLNVSVNCTVSPLLIPPTIPPLWLVAVFPSGNQASLCSDPLRDAADSPSPNPKDFTAFKLNRY